MKILILGAGPAGLGAAWRLNQAGHHDWELWEAGDGPGGLARSITDEHGFTWDIGGHVQFSHYRLFDEVMDRALGAEGWLHHQRESWVRIADTWVPYPFQYNIHRLPPESRERCRAGMERVVREGKAGPPYAHFGDMIDRTFGEGVAGLFMRPYNFKVWAWPPEELDTGWIGERVALPDLERIEESIRTHKDNVSWGPNSTFRFPRRGGTGAIWNAVASWLPAGKIHYGRAVQAIDPRARRAAATGGAQAGYDMLVSTIPLDLLVEMAGLDELRTHAARLRYSSVHVVGVGLTGQPPEALRGKCWMYFPEANSPFYRVTVFSHYSPENVPDIGRQWSLMAEVSESPVKPVDAARVREDTIRGMLDTGLIRERAQVNHTFALRIERGYPTPALGRDRALGVLLPALEKLNILSRGRFGAWKYEVSNQDHAFMQGVEAADHVLHGAAEETLWHPDRVNAPRPR
jgi:protoporphyrinogen oxidase